MTSPINIIHRLPAASLTAALLLLVLAACDSTGPDPDPDPDPDSDPGLVLDFQTATAPSSNGVLFGGLRHQAIGEATLFNDSVYPFALHITPIGTSGRDGFWADLDSIASLQRRFEPIDLSGEGTAVSWRARLSGDGLAPDDEIAWRMKNRGGTVELQADFHALAPDVTVQVWNDSLPYYKASSIELTDAIISLVDGDTGIALAGMRAAPHGHGLATELTFAAPVSIQVGQGPPVTGDQLRFVLLSHPPVHFTGDVWHFLPGVGSSRMDVVVTDVNTEPF